MPLKRVLFLDHTAAMGGGEIALLNLVSHLDRHRFEPVALLFSGGPLVARLKAAGVETHVLALASDVVQTRKDTLGVASLLRLRVVVDAMGFIVRLALKINLLGVQIVHTNSLKSDLLGGISARLAGKKLIWHVRDRIADDYLPARVVKAFRVLCRILPHKVIVISNATRSTVISPATDGPEPRWSSRVIVVHDGTILPRLDELRSSLTNIPAPLIGIIGRIAHWKGQHVFLRAAAIVRSRFPQARFQVIGAALFSEQDYENRMRTLASSLGLDDVVEFTGFRDDIPELLSRLDILVHASVSGEPFGQVIIEGMAAAKPVIATHGGAVPEIITDRDTGMIVPMGDVDGMAAAICELLEKPLEATDMGRRGRERVERYFTIAGTARKVERIYAAI